MALPAGTKLGAYEILGALGAGGMGEVYKARDTRLDRTVAIKVLPEGVAGDPQARDRFDREARAVAALNHPNICTLHDIGHQGGIDFLVMECLDGETLAARLVRGPLPIAQALRYAVQIAAALDKAHRAGIVHRDLKPGNVMLTTAGAGSTSSPQAKLLDFGLAKARVRAASEESTAMRAPELTTPGTILGTVQYMAPEQVEGKEADTRTDIFAFGAVLFEMLTGRKAFEGTSEASVIAAILERDPPALSALQPGVSAALDRIVRTCLAKDPDDRWQTARDLTRELTWVADSGGSPAAGSVRRSKLGWAMAAAALALVAGGWALGSFRSRSAPTPAISFSVHPPPGTKFPRGSAEMAVSPAGDRLAFVALSTDGQRRLWVRQFDSVNPRLLDGTEGVGHPFWSPDGRSLGFFANGKLKRIDYGGGPAQVLCEVHLRSGGTWNRDGTILFGAEGVIRRVPDTGGLPTAVTVLDSSRQETAHAWPLFLPDGRRFFYLARSSDRQQSGIYEGTLESTNTRRVMPGESNAALLGSHVLSVDNEALIARPYDSGGAQTSGEPIRVAEQIGYLGQSGGGAFAVGGNGVLAYRSASPDSHLIWFDRNGRQLGGFRDPGDYHHPWLSPDEKLVAVERTDAATGKHTIWILDVSRGTISRLLFDAAGAHVPVWSPDGRRIAFGSNRLGGIDLFSTRADGGGGDEKVGRPAEWTAFQHPTDWSLDGRFLLAATAHRGQADLWILPVGAAGTARLFIESPANERQGQFSPDVRWLAYTSDESGNHEVYVRPFPEADKKWRVSTNGGVQPRWRRDGRELFYLEPNGKLMAVTVRTGPSTFEPGTPTELFDTRITASIVDRRNHYVVTGDGQRFLVNISAEDENPAPITVVLNGASLLKKAP